MTFSKGVCAAKKEQITQILGVNVVEKHDRYLGMPAIVGRSKKEIFSMLGPDLERINGWGEKTLSGAGREVLIKAVLQSIPNYIMSCFELPLYPIRSLESAITKFWWSGGGNILPMKIELFRRHIALNPFCERCGVKVETLVHALFDCRGFESIWRGEPFNIGSIEPLSSMWSVLETLRPSLSTELFLDVVVLCWKIWELRNKDIHGSFEDLPRDVVAWAKEYRASYLAAQIGESLDSDSAVVTQWRPPEPGVVKINVDVALRAGRDFFRIGLIARDSDGNMVWWQVKKMDRRPTPVDGEAMAVLHGVLLARSMDWPQVVIETDSL